MEKLKRNEEGFLEPGQVIGGKYEILRKVGKGGMSKVYLVMNEEVNREWAVKEIQKSSGEGGAGDTAPADAQNEAYIMSRLNNRHIPRITEVIEMEESILLVMDYVEGRTLRARLRSEGAIPQEEAVNIALQMCETLEYLHSLDPPVIFRDIKPDNIILRPDGTCVLIDFGAAREYKETKEEENIGDTICLGTRGYAPPEQYKGAGMGQTDKRSDIYALGATMYHMVTGKDPSRKPYEMRPIRRWDPALSSGLEAVIKKCTQNDPEERYQDVSQLKEALLHYRELDVEYQREKNGLVARCAALFFAGVLCMASGLWSGVQAASLKGSTYAELIQAAETAVTKEDRMDAYARAVAADPKKEDAYNGMLKDALADNKFTQDEAEAITKVLGYRGADDVETAETKFREGNRRQYDEFAYNCGLAYFYYYGQDGNKPLSLPWFRAAKESRTLGEVKKKRAEKFYSIADYYVALSSRDRAGDSAVSFGQYWNDLVMLSSGDIIHEDNMQTALVVYRDLVYQIAVHAQDFKNAGVAREDVESEIEMVVSKVTEEILPSAQYKEGQVKEAADTALTNAEKAKAAMEAAYQGIEREGET